MITISIVVSNL